MKYLRLRILNQFLEKGLNNKSTWGKVEPKGELPRLTDYDEALHLLGFEDYLQKILKVENTYRNFELHLIYVKLIKDYLGEESLNRYEITKLDESKKESQIEEMLKTSKRYLLDKDYYNDRVPLTKKEFAGTLLVTKRFVKNLKGKEGFLKLNPIKRYKNPIENNSVEIGRIKPNGDLIVGGYDERAMTIFALNDKFPYMLNIHPYLFQKLTPYIPSVTKRPKTIYSSFENPRAEDFEVIFLILLEFLLTKGVDAISEMLNPAISLGKAISNRVCVAYAVPEVPGELEHFKVIFRYGEGIEMITDRDRLEKVMSLRGLTYNEPIKTRNMNESPIVREEGISAWDSIFLGAYKPRNGNENDIRGGNLMK